MSWTSVVAEEVVIRSWTFREALKVGPIGFANIGMCNMREKESRTVPRFLVCATGRMELPFAEILFEITSRPIILYVS